jgi:hypothetical protein
VSCEIRPRSDTREHPGFVLAYSTMSGENRGRWSIQRHPHVRASGERDIRVVRLFGVYGAYAPRMIGERFSTLSVRR